MEEPRPSFVAAFVHSVAVLALDADAQVAWVRQLVCQGETDPLAGLELVGSWSPVLTSLRLKGYDCAAVERSVWVSVDVVEGRVVPVIDVPQ